MTPFELARTREQNERNQALITDATVLGEKVISDVHRLRIDIDTCEHLGVELQAALQALEIEAARTAIEALAALASINEMDHLGGGLELIPALTLSLALTDYEAREYTVEHAHTSIGYYSALAAVGFLRRQYVIDRFRRSLDIAGHISWVPGGTQLNGGRLGVIVPVAVGQALGKRALYGEDAWLLCHCGDAGWISGQALNGFNAADLHNAPISFVMHRNGIQLSGTTQSVMDKDPRRLIEAMGLRIIETESLHDCAALYRAYREARSLAREGRPALIYPTGEDDTALGDFAEEWGIVRETEAFALRHGVAMDTRLHIPGSLMSFRDVESMLECVFLVNNLPGGAGHHDGHMKGRSVEAVLANPMLQLTGEQQAALDTIRAGSAGQAVTIGRPAAGSPNLVLPEDILDTIQLPEAGSSVSARAGSEAAYAAVAEHYPDNVFVVSCDLDPSTKLARARTFLAADRQFEMSIQEQASALMANGLAMAAPQRPQLTVFSTFAAFFEGIAREGFELWRYQRNLNGVNEGLNVAMHLSHVGANTGRDHFSGWGLDWINLAIGYLPYLRRFYAPADARAAFVAVRDMAAHYGGHIIGIPRDTLPVLEKQEGGPLWNAHSPWSALTPYRRYPGARRAILALGAPAFLAGEAAHRLEGEATSDVYIVNGLPLEHSAVAELCARYPEGMVTVEDGIIGNRRTGLRGFAAVLAGMVHGVPTEHVGIIDPRVAPSDGFAEVWAHFGITADSIESAVLALRGKA